PPGMYAAIAVASWPIGQVTEWSARLPSALAATACMFLFYWYFGRVLGRFGGLLAALILPLSFAWLDKASAAEIDMLQLAWVTAAIFFFLRGLEIEEAKSVLMGSPPHPKPPLQGGREENALWWWMGALVCVAGGLLTKWTAPVFFYGTVVPLLWWRGRLRLLWRPSHLLSLPTAAAICTVWVAGVVYQEGWRPLYETVRREALVHLSPQHHPRPYP